MCCARLAGGDQRLGRDAAIVEAVAAHLVLLDQHDGDAELRRSGRHGQAARAGADDAQIGAQLAAAVLCRRPGCALPDATVTAVPSPGRTRIKPTAPSLGCCMAVSSIS